MKRWWMLALGVNAHASVTLGLFGLPLVMPEILRHFDVSLPVGGLIGNAPAIGILCALVATPLAGLLIEGAGYWAGFAAGLGCALVSLPVIPLRADRS
ncbi:hypothetical protein ABZW11_22505 [Nonomuraea sp. NPDC004580]|uniref:hypothetical protein n=1 Tax=Nonomuraea sp. NPDC004580 TaxID=3154552 RepID=UPI0033B0D2E7